MNEVLSSHYLDTLPAHPRPQPLESLNSYLKRVAHANGIHHIATFSHLTGVREPKRLLELTPASDFRQLGTVTCCSDWELLAMTVYFLGHKFGREQSLGRFFAPSLARHQRWCPACLVQQGYVRLPWSFLHLAGCPQHGLRLLDTCPHCERPLRLKSASLSLHHCPHCTGDLRQSDGIEMTELEWQQCQRDWDDLAYLLIPQTWQKDEGASVIAAFRQRLGFLRRASGVEAKRFARLLGLRPRILVALENETASGCGETFDDYLRYTRQMGLVLSDVFRDCTAVGYVSKDRLYADALLCQAQAAVRQFRSEQLPVTQKRVAQHMGHTPAMLRNYPAIAACLRAEALVCKQRTDAYEDALYRHTQQVIHTFTAQGKRVTRRAVCFQLEQTPARIRKFYPRVDRLLDEAVQAQQQRYVQRYATLLEQVQASLVLFREQNLLVTQVKIAQHLGIPAHRLGCHEAVRQLIAEQTAMSQQLWLQTTTARVRVTMTQIEEQGNSISQSELAARLELSRDVFQQYPDLQALWQVFAQRQYQRHEAALLARVEAAMDTCKTQGLPLTFRQITALAGVSRAALRRYPRIFALLSARGLVRANPDSQSVPK